MPARLRALVELTLVAVAVALGVLLLQTDDAGWPGRATPLLRMAGLLALASGLLWRGGETWRGLGLRRPEGLRRSVGLILAGYVAVLAAAALAHGLLSLAGVDATTPLTRIRGEGGLLAYWLVVAWTSGAFGEEMLFRGFLLDRAERALGGGPTALAGAVVVQAAGFGAAHMVQGPGGAILAGVTGLVLGGVYLVGGRNLWPCILLHGMIDTISLAAIYGGAAGLPA